MRLRICVIGNILGRNPGYVTTQGQILADLLSGDGHKVISASSRLNRFLRFGEIVATVLKCRNSTDVLILEVYSGVYFVLVDVVGLISKYLGIHSIFVLHGGNLPEFSRRYPNWTSRVLRRASTLVAPSPFLARELADLNLAIRVVPNIVEIGSCPFRLRKSAEPKLLWMRAFHTLYNPHMALEVFRAVRDKHAKATLVMAGVDKGLEPEIRKRTDEMGLTHAVRFPGFLSKTEKLREFSDADIFLNTNRVDNMPVAVVEACAMGLPVVSTDVGGIPDLLTNNENGILVADNDTAAMTEAIDGLLMNSALSEKLSRNGRLLAERSSWTSVRDDWSDLFDRTKLGKRVLSDVDTALSQGSNP